MQEYRQDSKLPIATYNSHVKIYVDASKTEKSFEHNLNQTIVYSWSWSYGYSTKIAQAIKVINKDEKDLKYRKYVIITDSCSAIENNWNKNIQNIKSSAYDLSLKNKPMYFFFGFQATKEFLKIVDQAAMKGHYSGIIFLPIYSWELL